MPVSLDRIRQGLATPRELKLDSELPKFRVEVFGLQSRLKDFLPNESLKVGPLSPWGPYHQEFLNLVTPTWAQPYAAFTSGELAQVLATTLLGQLLMNKLPGAFRDARAEREREAARKEIAEALAIIEKNKRDQP